MTTGGDPLKGWQGRELGHSREKARYDRGYRLGAGDLPGRELAQLLAPLKEQLDREINPVTLRKDEFRENAERGDSFIRSILKEPKIFLLGDEDGLQTLVDGRAA